MIYLTFYLTHLLADYPFQTNHIAKNKSKKMIYALKHLGIHLILMIFGFTILSIIDKSNQLSSVNVIFLITGSVILVLFCHFIIDFKVKPLIENTFSDFLFKNSIVLFIDQMMHIFSLILVPFLLSKILSISIHSIFAFDYSITEMYLWLLILIINLTFVSGTFIRNLFLDLNKNKQNEIQFLKDIPNEYTGIDIVITKKINEKTTINYNYYQSDEVQNFGKLIGFIERILIFILIISSNFEGVILLFGLKTFARYKQFDSKSFSEQFVLGTMISLLIAILISGFAMLIGIEFKI